MKLLFDIETDGLYWELTKIHCVTILDLDTEELVSYNDVGSCESIATAVGILDGAEWVVGHNIIGYDIPVIQRFFPFFNPNPLDSLLISKLLYPNIKQSDFATRRLDKQKRLIGSHGLEAWGYRLGLHKGNFGKTTDWKTWSQEMQDYNRLDVQVNHTLWRHFQKTLTGLP